MTDAREVRALLDDRPNLEPALESLLETDADHETWTFDDAGVDSGSFGALVDEGVVEKVDGEYRLADADAVERGLAGDVETEEGSGSSFSLPSFDIDRRMAAALAGALVLMFVFRLVTFERVFYPDAIVLSGNDPYFYLYWVEEISRTATGVGEAVGLSSASYGILKGEPLLVVTLWMATALLGGVEQAPLVLAWYPVVSALLVGLFVYVLAVGLTEDRRVALAAVVFLAVTPVHALRSSVGFADHHAFDYIWLTLTAAAAVHLARLPPTREAITERTTLLWATVFGIGVGAQLLSWDGAPLLLFPLVLYVPLAALVAVDAGESPALSLAPFGIGTAVAAVVSGGIHLALGWQTNQVAFAPLFLLAGIVGITALGEGVVRLEDELPVRPIRAVLAGEIVGAATAGIVLMAVLPAYGQRLSSELARVATTDDIVEASSLFSTDTFGWLFLFGFLLILAVPYFLWGIHRAAVGPDRQPWLVFSTYTGTMLLLATLQMRFAGELSPFIAVLVGLGFVHIAERVDVATAPAPFRSTQSTPTHTDGGEEREAAFGRPNVRQVGTLLLLFLMINGVGVAQTPIKANQITIQPATYHTASTIADHSEANELEYPQNYVLSPWSRNRVYNYFVNGQSESYGYAFDNYEQIAGANNPDEVYRGIHDRVGYIAFPPSQASDATLYTRLAVGMGGYYKGYRGSGHYRAVHIGDRRAFQLVPGANVTGEAPPNATVRLETTKEITGKSITYIRRANVTASGEYRVQLAYAGEYTITTGDSNGTRTITVPESAVENGDPVDAGTLPGNGSASGQSQLRRPAYQVSPS